VLLPLKWETHSAPEFGKRPQEVINRQVVDFCDLLVGIFWTRIGTPTGKADSGTLEAIERVAREGKKVLLYFSQLKAEPDHLDLEQLAKLREFKQKTFPKALVERYTDIIEFRDKLAKHLEIQLRAIVAEESSSISDASRPLTDIRLHLVDAAGADRDTELDLETSYLVVPDFSEIEDFSPPKAETNAGPAGLLLTPPVNTDYYRDYVSFVVQKNLLAPIRFWLKNDGQIGARDVYVRLIARSPKKNLILVPANSVRTSPPSEASDFYAFQTGKYIKPDELVSSANDTWRWELELKALQ